MSVENYVLAGVADFSGNLMSVKDDLRLEKHEHHTEYEFQWLITYMA